MLDLIPAQQPIKNQHQILWCVYQHVITAGPIAALVFMRRPAFFCFWCECSSTDKTRRKKTCVFGVNRPLHVAERGYPCLGSASAVEQQPKAIPRTKHGQAKIDQI